MRAVRRFFARFANLFRRGIAERDLAAEIEAHLALMQEEFERRGMTAEEARREALVKLGGVEQAKEMHREARTLPWLGSLGQDIRFALRMMHKNPGFVAAIVVTLALGVGANVTMMSVVQVLLFRAPAHVRQPDEILRVEAVDKTGRTQMVMGNYPGFRRLADNSHLLQLAAQGSAGPTDYGSGSRAREIQGASITHGYFDVLGAQLQMGRAFTTEEEARLGGAPVVILGYDFWKEEFAGDPKIIGQEIPIDGKSQTVIGIAQRGFTGMDQSTVDVWMPISDHPWRPGKDPVTDAQTWWLDVIGRTVPGVTRVQAAAGATVAFGNNSDSEMETIRLRPYFIDRMKTPNKAARVSLWLAGVAFVVFLIASANVTNLFLVRAMQRGQEIAVRLQLGATRGRLIRHMLAESLLASLLGGMVALLLAYCARPLVRAFLLPPNYYQGDPFSWEMLALAASFAGLAGVAGRLWPVWRVGRAECMQMPSSTGRPLRERSVARSVILVAQVALTFLLTIGAALFVRSLRSVDAIELGFDAPHVLVATMASSGYKPEQISAAYERLRERAESIPGVEDTAIADSVPFASYSLGTFRVAASGSSPERQVNAGMSAVSPDYFAAMGMRVLQGRSFTRADGAGAPPVVMVTQSLANELAPTGNPVGAYLITYDRKPLQIIGVVPDERRMFLFDNVPGQPKGSLYTPLDQSGSATFASSTGLVMRTARNPSGVQRSVAAALASVAPGSRYVNVRPITDLIDRQTLPWRMGASTFLLFGGLALVLAAVGIYGVLAFLVKQRTAEIGVRLALGATPADIVKLVVARGIALVSAGIAIGTVAGLGLARLMQSVLYGVTATDPASYVLTVIVVVCVGLAACVIPACRAMRVDPMVALRHE